MILGLVPPSLRLLHFSRAALSSSDDFHSVLFPALLEFVISPNFFASYSLAPLRATAAAAASRLPRSISFAMCLILFSSISFTLKVSKTESGEVCDALSSSRGRGAHLHKLCQARLYFGAGERGGVCSFAENSSEKHRLSTLPRV